MKSILVLLMAICFIFTNNSTSELFNSNELTTPVPNLIEQQLATVQGTPAPYSGSIIGNDTLPWVFYTTDNKIYTGDNNVIPGTLAPAAVFTGNKKIIGSIDYRRPSNVGFAYIITEEVTPQSSTQYVLYSFNPVTHLVNQLAILFQAEPIAGITAIGMVNMPDNATYLIVAGTSIFNTRNSILTGIMVSFSTTPATFPYIEIPNTEFQNFSKFFVDDDTSLINRQKLYYTSNQYNPETGAWSNGYVGSLTFNLFSQTYSLGTNKVYSPPTGKTNLRFAWYYDERLLAWDGTNASNKFYWVDTAAVVGVIFGEVTVPLLSNISFIFNNDGDDQEFTIYGIALDLLSTGFGFDWNSKQTSILPTQLFLRNYSDIFGGQTNILGKGGTYGLSFNSATNTTRVYRFTGL